MVAPIVGTYWMLTMGSGTKGNTSLCGGTRASATAAGGGSLPASWLSGCQVAGHSGAHLFGEGGSVPDSLLSKTFQPINLLQIITMAT